MNIDNPKNVIRIERDELALNYKYREGGEFLNNIDICSYEYEFPELNRRYDFHPIGFVPQVGDTYVKSPFGENLYIEIEYFSDYILECKSNCISNIARLLGASSYSFEIEVEDISNRSWDLKAGMSYSSVSAELQVKRATQEKLNKRFADRKLYSHGRRPTAQEFREAEDFAKQYGLYTDNKVKALLNERNPNSANMVRQMCVTFSLSQEMNQSLDIAFKLNAMKGVFGLNAAFNEATEQKKTINGKLDIQFGCD